MSIEIANGYDIMFDGHRVATIDESLPEGIVEGFFEELNLLIDDGSDTDTVRRIRGLLRTVVYDELHGSI